MEVEEVEVEEVEVVEQQLEVVAEQVNLKK